MRKLCFLALCGCTAFGGGELPASIEGDLSHSGLSYTDLVTSEPYDTLRIVVHRAPGEAPSDGAAARVLRELERLRALGALGKPGGVELLDGAVVPLDGTEHTAEALDRALVEHAWPPTNGDAAVVNVLYADGHYAGDGESQAILGYAYGGGYLVMLPDSIDHTCHEGLGSLTEEACEAVEAMVLLHELGHLFGLVDNGVPMVRDHVDRANGHHDRSEDCVMYWSIARPGVLAALAQAWLTGTDMNGFDRDCVDDLLAVQP